ncbi:MAG: HAMP domain-containing protein [Acidobacteria bacterium]|nr:HAMP domain-containing protein [Acidobacteriota bacterium]
MKLLRGMRGRILLWLVLAGLLPLAAALLLFYQFARRIIVDDRVEIYLHHLSQQTADKLDLFLTERREEGAAMASNEGVEAFLRGVPAPAPVASPTLATLNEYVQIHEVYDLMVLVDSAGTIRACNSINRFGDWFDPRLLNELVGQAVDTYPVEAAAWRQAMQGRAAVHDWYASPLAHRLYFFEDDDASRSYHLLFAQPVRDHATGRVLGVWLNIMNWEYIQAQLDLVESDFRRYGLPSGYALLLSRDDRRILAAPQRRNRRPGDTANRLGAELDAQSGLTALPAAIRAGGATVHLPAPVARYGGLARVGSRDFGWRIVVTLSEEDIFKPVYQLALAFTGIVSVAVVLVVAGAWLLSRQISRPLLSLTESAREIARGQYHRRVQPTADDEIGSLGDAFNQMARTVEERQQELEAINRDLEVKVRHRTEELEASNRELRQALQDLHDAQDQLVQSEKMASLGRLVAGIAHEIKNPLNFIYGNTRFLDEYADKLGRYLARVNAGAAPAELVRLREELRIDFILGDIGGLAANIHEGAERIKTIVDDLRVFSRAPSGEPEEVDLCKVLDMCLNLLRNQYKNRIRIVREYGAIPPARVLVGKMEQVFLNLLSNAIDAIEGEGVIRVRTFTENGRVVIEVADSGPGIPPEHLNRIFDPFFTTKDVGQGTGLGLSLSYSIVQQHGGALRARNGADGGAVFRVELPPDGPPAAAAEEAP